MANEVRQANWKDTFRYYLGFGGRLLMLEIDGNSMSPTINSGDRVLYDRLITPKVGDIVLASHPYVKSVKIVKRIGDIIEPDKVVLIGDNPSESTDSRAFGMISIKSIEGCVVCRWK